MKCLYCKSETSNPKFCSKSCSAKYNNVTFPKRKIISRKCKECGKPIPISRDKNGKVKRKFLCDSCNPNIIDWNTITKKEMKLRRNYQAYSAIRELARKIYRKSDKPKECIICGYSIYYEVCHKKAISSFSDETTISEINSLDNLIALCPNHHYELDNSLLFLA